MYALALFYDWVMFKGYEARIPQVIRLFLEDMSMRVFEVGMDRIMGDPRYVEDPVSRKDAAIVRSLVVVMAVYRRTSHMLGLWDNHTVARFHGIMVNYALYRGVDGGDITYT